MKVLVIGGLGSIGSRYCAILTYLGHEPIVYDKVDGSHVTVLPEYDRAIIATPTETHYSFCKLLTEIGKPFLCEKPLSKNLEECRELAEIRNGGVVNNYWHAMKSYGNNPQDTFPISYNYYKTGKDSLYWDACQLIYMNPKCEIKTKSPVFTLETNKGFLKLEDIERSYVLMIKEFLSYSFDGSASGLWNMTNGYEMTKAVLVRIDEEALNRNPS